MGNFRKYLTVAAFTATAGTVTLLGIQMKNLKRQVFEMEREMRLNKIAKNDHFTVIEDHDGRIKHLEKQLTDLIRIIQAPPAEVN